ncbi:hypothetical protein HPB51_006364 [Rhipicephalus microplus]|uniref:Uncharacterized protein n=1 Tax=Rhipicephalus microplus TaxID=6941 RepID=A0A9J6DLZ2_RHIMP|nr:hypothetical protein HPB51_006364 [Rhipicephalus microplus]
MNESYENTPLREEPDERHRVQAALQAQRKHDRKNPPTAPDFTRTYGPPNSCTYHTQQLRRTRHRHCTQPKTLFFFFLARDEIEHSAQPPTNAPAPALREKLNTAAAIAAAEASAAPPPPFYAATVAPLQIGGGGRLEQRLGNLCQANILHGAAVARSQATGVTEVEDD